MILKQKFATVQELKEASPVFPDFILVEDENHYTISSMVRVFRRGKWYLAHIVSDEVAMKFTPHRELFAAMFKRFLKIVHSTQHEFDLDGLTKENLDPFQGSEEERMRLPKKKL